MNLTSSYICSFLLIVAPMISYKNGVAEEREKISTLINQAISEVAPPPGDVSEGLPPLTVEQNAKLQILLQLAEKIKQ